VDNPCQGTKRDGTPCSKGAMGAEARRKHGVPNDVPPLCFWCWRGNDRMIRAGNKGMHAAARRKKSAQFRIGDFFSYEDVFAVLAEALTATVNEPGWPRVPDYSARLAACALLIECFPEYLRETPEQVRELLGRALPAHVERADPDAFYRALAHEKYRLRERGHPLTQFETQGRT
jgi:hypothetical protein